MMNDEMEPFERRLSRQPLRQIPHEWRGEILAAARDAQPVFHLSSLSRPGWLSTISSQLSTLLWPHPKAWAALAAIWIFVIAVNVSLRDNSPRRAENTTLPSPEMIVELRQQQRLFAELIGPREPRDADRPRIFMPKPRGARREIVVV